MRLVRYTHSCVRLERDGRVLVLDPGAWSEPRALRGADAVLLTHEHGDHVDELRLAGLGVPVFAPAGAALSIPFTPVSAGSFEAAGFSVQAVGGRHAEVYAGEPSCANLGYVVDGAVYHPGDSVHVPEVAVDTLLIPAQASWLKTAEALDFARAIAPRRSFLIHDAQINARGLSSINAWLTDHAPGYTYLPPATSIEVTP